MISTPAFSQTIGQKNVQNSKSILQLESTIKIEFISHVVNCQIGTKTCSGKVMAISDIKTMIQFFMDNGDVIGLEVSKITSEKYGLKLHISASLLNDKPGIPSVGACNISPNKLNGDNIICEVHLKGSKNLLEIMAQTDARNIFQRKD